MSRIGSCFKRLAVARRKALVPYIIAGDAPGGSVQSTVDCLHSLVAGGADLLELGMPFSDPMAEGPVIQRGHERALAQGTTLLSTLEMVRSFRCDDELTPVVLMGYSNPVLRYGSGSFATAAAAAGVDGLLLVDMPPEDSAELPAELKAAGIDMIRLAAPTTGAERLHDIAASVSGYLYYVSLCGVTGADSLDVEATRIKLAQLRRVVKQPVCVGFGIRTAAAAAALGELADGIVVGSLLVDKLGQLASGDSRTAAAALHDLLAPLRAALDGVGEADDQLVR